MCRSRGESRGKGVPDECIANILQRSSHTCYLLIHAPTSSSAWMLPPHARDASDSIDVTLFPRMTCASTPRQPSSSRDHAPGWSARTMVPQGIFSAPPSSRASSKTKLRKMSKPRR